MAGEERLDSLVSPWQPSWLRLINLPLVCCITTFHYMTSYLLGFTQFMLLSLEGKKISRDQQVMAPGVLQEKKEKDFFCFFQCSWQESDDFHVVFTKAAIFFFSFLSPVFMFNSYKR